MNAPTQIRLNAEANTQAEIYHHCQLRFIECALEVTTPIGRLDLVILNQSRTAFLAIVETKKNRLDTTPEMHLKSPQVCRYKRIGVPVYVIDDFKNVETFVQWLETQIPDLTEVFFDSVLTLKPTIRGSFSTKRVSQKTLLSALAQEIAENLSIR